MSVPFRRFRVSRRAAVAAATLLLAATALFAPIPLQAGAPQTHTVTLTARAFAYDPPVLHVQAGDTVVLRLESLDVVHGLALDGHDLRLEAEPGRSAEAVWVADRPGKWKFRCSIACGPLHPFMVGEIEVGPNLTFGRGLAALLVVVIGTAAFMYPGGPHKNASRGGVERPHWSRVGKQDVGPN